MIMYKGRKHKLHKGPRKGYYIIINKTKRYIKNYGKKKTVMKGGESFEHHKTRGIGPLIETKVAYRGGTRIDEQVLALYHHALKECNMTHYELSWSSMHTCDWNCGDHVRANVDVMSHRDIKPSYRPMGKRNDINYEQVAILRHNLETFMEINKCTNANDEKGRVDRLKELLNVRTGDIPLLGGITKFPFQKDPQLRLQDLIIKLRIIRRLKTEGHIGPVSRPDFNELLSIDMPDFKKKLLLKLNHINSEFNDQDPLYRHYRSIAKEETTKMILHHPPNNNHHLFLASSAKHFYASIIFIMLSRIHTLIIKSNTKLAV